MFIKVLNGLTMCNEERLKPCSTRVLQSSRGRGFAETILLDEKYPLFFGEILGRVSHPREAAECKCPEEGDRDTFGILKWEMNRFFSVIEGVILQVNSSIHVPPSAQLSVILSLNQRQYLLLASFHRQNLINITRNQGPLPSHPLLLLLVIELIFTLPLLLQMLSQLQ